jgi:hypothetical protein
LFSTPQTLTFFTAKPYNCTPVPKYLYRNINQMIVL